MKAMAFIWSTGRWYFANEIRETLKEEYNVSLSSKEVLNVLREINPDFEIKRLGHGYAVFLPVSP